MSREKAAKLLFGAYTVAVFSFRLLYHKVTMFGLMPKVLTYGEYLRTHINYIPFRTIIGYIHVFPISVRTSLEYLVGHVLLFIPCGVFPPLLWKSTRRYGKLALLVLSEAVFIELVQWLTAFGFFDVDDLILNFLGASIGFAVHGISCRKNAFERRN